MFRCVAVQAGTGRATSSTAETGCGVGGAAVRDRAVWEVNMRTSASGNVPCVGTPHVRGTCTWSTTTRIDGGTPIIRTCIAIRGVAATGSIVGGERFVTHSILDLRAHIAHHHQPPHQPLHQPADGTTGTDGRGRRGSPVSSNCFLWSAQDLGRLGGLVQAETPFFRSRRGHGVVPAPLVIIGGGHAALADAYHGGAPGMLSDGAAGGATARDATAVARVEQGRAAARGGTAVRGGGPGNVEGVGVGGGADARLVPLAVVAAVRLRVRH